DSLTEEAKTESNIWDDESEDINPFGGGKPRYRDHRYRLFFNDHAIDHDDRHRDDPIWSMECKIKIPDFIDWLSTVERVIDVRDIPDKLKVKLVAIKIRQHASL
nr:reverse transcriptase domain-containing protein [Tanacetum cinerariifolium]